MTNFYSVRQLESYMDGFVADIPRNSFVDHRRIDVVRNQQRSIIPIRDWISAKIVIGSFSAEKFIHVIFFADYCQINFPRNFYIKFKICLQ